MSFKVMVRPTGEKNFACNGLRFATEEQAKEYGKDLFMRWFAVEEWKVETSGDEVNR